MTKRKPPFKGFSYRLALWLLGCIFFYLLARYSSYR